MEFHHLVATCSLAVFWVVAGTTYALTSGMTPATGTAFVGGMVVTAGLPVVAILWIRRYGGRATR